MTRGLPLHLKPPAVEQALLCEGISRAGKMLLGKLVSNFAGIEFFQLADPLDHIPILWRLGTLGRGDAVALLRLSLDSHSYNRAIGRNLNGRIDDATSLVHALNRSDYEGRAETPDAGKVWGDFRERGGLPCYLVHEMIPHIELYFDAVPELKVVHVDRHPVDLCHSWLRRGWGERWGEDPLAFIPVAAHPDGPVPWFAADWADAFRALAPADRAVQAVCRLRALYTETFATLDTERNGRILKISYEHLVERPVETLNYVADFLATQPLNGFEAILEHERLPGAPRAEDRPTKLSELIDAATDESLRMLTDEARVYEAQWAMEPSP